MNRLFSRRQVLGVALPGFLLGTAFTRRAVAAEDQPRMRSALHNLRAALNDLQSATNDKGGHRVGAINHVKQAIDQVEKGINFDNRNRRR